MASYRQLTLIYSDLRNVHGPVTAEPYSRSRPSTIDRAVAVATRPGIDSDPVRRYGSYL
jgi:hypothetical protein